MVFYDGAEFLANTGAGSGGAILNRAKLVFKVDEGDFSTLTFKDNLSGEDEVREEKGRPKPKRGIISPTCDLAFISLRT